jgi:rare lipoprotein A|nr:MAG TPA: lipoprotein [Caudoviricetes sp.]
MKRNFLKAIALLLLGVFVLTQGAESGITFENINDTILYYRTLERKENKTPEIRKEMKRLQEVIKTFDESPQAKLGRMSTLEEIDLAIRQALEDTGTEPKQPYHSMQVALISKIKQDEDDIEDASKDSENVKKSYTRISGDVSHYGYNLHGSQTATGGRFDQWAMTAAHKTLPFGSVVRVTNKANGKSVTVRINDRGPYIKGRVLDLSRGAFLKIAPQKQGILKAENVLIEVIKYGNGKRKENR